VAPGSGPAGRFAFQLLPLHFPEHMPKHDGVRVTERPAFVNHAGMRPVRLSVKERAQTRTAQHASPESVSLRSRRRPGLRIRHCIR